MGDKEKNDERQEKELAQQDCRNKQKDLQKSWF